MPVISVNLDDIAYEGFKTIPRGQRSRVVSGLLYELNLDKTRVLLSHEVGAVSARTVLEHNRELSKANAALSKSLRTLQKTKGEEEE